MLMQPTFAAFNFKSLSNDQDGLSPSTLEKNVDACCFPTSVDPPPKKKRNCFHPHGLPSLTCLVSTRKEKRCILRFILMKLMIKISV